MGMDRYSRQLFNQKASDITTGLGEPSNAEGSSGSISIRDINGQMKLFAKYGSTWHGTDLGPTLTVGDTHLKHITLGAEGLNINDGDTNIASFQEDITLTSGTINFHDGTRNRLVIGANDIDMYDEAGTNVLNIDTGDVTLTGGTVTIRNATNNNDKVVLAEDSLKVYDNNTEVASFGATTTIGPSNGEHLEITSNTIKFIGSDGSTPRLSIDSSGNMALASASTTTIQDAVFKGKVMKIPRNASSFDPASDLSDQEGCFYFTNDKKLCIAYKDGSTTYYQATAAMSGGAAIFGGGAATNDGSGGGDAPD